MNTIDTPTWRFVIYHSRAVAVHLNCRDGNTKKDIFPENKTITLGTATICYCGEPVPEHILLQRKIVNGE